jgi:hypothetical protein
MSEDKSERDRKTRRDLKLTLTVATVSLPFYWILPQPWNNFALILAIAFYIMAFGVFVQR